MKWFKVNVSNRSENISCDIPEADVDVEDFVSRDIESSGDSETARTKQKLKLAENRMEIRDRVYLVHILCEILNFFMSGSSFYQMHSVWLTFHVFAVLVQWTIFTIIQRYGKYVHASRCNYVLRDILRLFIG